MGNRQLRCPDCDSPRVILGLDYPFLKTDEYVCHECGATNNISLLSEESNASPRRECPHCGRIDDFEVRGDEEWCLECELSPEREYSSPEISHLWKKGSSIQILLDQNAERFRLGTDRGTFLRCACGPMCQEAEDCRQDVSIFEICFKVGLEGQGSEAASVSKKSRKKRRQREARMYSAKATKEALLICANNGWLAGRLYETDYQKSPGDSESRSGTKAISQGLPNLSES